MFDDSNPNLGVYDMRVYLAEDAPKSLHKTLNNNICNKGGGGGGTTVTKSGIDEEFKPYLETVLKDVTKRYESEVAGGPDAIVAAMTEEQKAALDAQKASAREMMEGTGAYDTTAARQRDVQNLMGSAVGQAASAGGLGSARGERAMMGAVADRSLELQRARQADIQQGIAGLGEVGSAKQAYEQQRLDAPHTSAQRYFGYLSGAPQTQTQTSSGGGGK